MKCDDPVKVESRGTVSATRLGIRNDLLFPHPQLDSITSVNNSLPADIFLSSFPNFPNLVKKSTSYVLSNPIIPPPNPGLAAERSIT